MNEFLVFEGCHNLTRYKKMEVTSIVHKIEFGFHWIIILEMSQTIACKRQHAADLYLSLIF
jgi:hypothetical protein